MATHTQSTLTIVVNLLLNLLNFAFLVIATLLVLSWSSFTFTFLRLCEIVVAEYYRRSISGGPDQIGEVSQRQEEKLSPHGLGSRSSALSSTIGCVVGWREESDLYEDCLKSLKSEGTRSVVVGIDGDSQEDAVMLGVFQQIFQLAPIIRFPEPVGELVENAMLIEDANDLDLEEALRKAMAYVKSILEDHVGESLASVTSICVVQPHRSKKDILFTSMLVSLVLADASGSDFIWSSDSDSVVQANSVQTAISVLSKNLRNGGASTRLRSFHKQPTPVSKMVTAKYWYDQDVTRMQTAALHSSECQPGPCSAFRVPAMKDILLPWYLQRVRGRKMIVNEDRHLTTNLLHRNWGVLYIPGALVLTEAPNTVVAYIKQQVRWSRGTHIERLSRPIIYARKNGWFSLQVWKDQVLPFMVLASIIEYLSGREVSLQVSLLDVLVCSTQELIYTWLTAIDKPTGEDLVWFMPAQLCFGLTKPPIHLWAMMTPFQSSWGTGPQAQAVPNPRRQRWYDVGCCAVWFEVLSAAAGKALADSVNFHHRELLPATLVSAITPLLAAPFIYWLFFGDLH